MGAPYRIYAHNGLEASACAYYRMVLPLTTMEKLGLPIETILDNGASYVSPHLRAAMFMESDLTLVYQNTGGVANEWMKATAGFKPMLSGNDVRWPPTYVIDTDDDLFNVMPLNETYGSLGTRRHDGSPLKPGDEVGIAHPLEHASAEEESILNGKSPAPMPGMRENIDDKRFIYGGDSKWHLFFSLWRGSGAQQNFDIASNQKRIENWREVLKMGQLVTCSTPRAEAYVKREAGDQVNTFVSPNAIDFEEYPELELREHPGKVRVLWEGSACHHEGLWPLNASLVRLAEKYPEVEWVFWGAPYKWAIKNMPKGSVTLLPWVSYDAYKIRLSTIVHDICLAPLATSVFNDSRSAIRWYESSAIWRPAATIAQRHAAFRDEIIDGETGLLFDTTAEFEEKLGGLIEDEKLRKTLASNAKDWVRTHREAKKIGMRLFQKYVEVRENHKLTMPTPAESEPDSANPSIV